MAGVTAQGRGRRGGRVEPAGGWPLGVKTSVPPESGPAEELTPEEAARREASDALAAKRRSDRMARRDEADLALDRHQVPEGRSPFKARDRGNEPRSPFGGDPAEERRIADRAARGESSSVWVQDGRAEHYRESWDEQQAARLRNEGEAAEQELRKAVRGGLSELVRVRTVVLADRFTASGAELERLESRPRLEDDGRRANRRDRAQVVDDGLPLAPPLGPALAHVEVDPALVALAAGRYRGVVLEPSAKPEWLEGPGRAETAEEAPEAIERALNDVEAAYALRWRDDPARAATLERRWTRERDELRESASASPAPEETRLLVEGMREYADELAETGRGVCYAVRVHTALGRDPETSPIAPDALDRALDSYPDVAEGIRQVDPDSPLCVAPAGAGKAYGLLLERSLDGARAAVVAAREAGASLTEGVVRARVLASVAEGVEARERAAERDSAARGAADERGGPSSADPVSSVRAREMRDRLDRAEERFGDLTAALESHGVVFGIGRTTDTVRTPGSAGLDVQLAADRFMLLSEQGRDGERFEGPVPVGSPAERRDAVAAAMGAAADAVWSPEQKPAGAAQRFGERMAARVFDEPLPLPESVSPEAEAAAAWLASEVGAEASKLALERAHRVEAREDAVERFEKVLEAVDGTVAVRSRDFVDSDPDGLKAGYGVRRDPASGAVSSVVLVDPRCRAGDRSLTNSQLAAAHGEAYLALGRALGAADRNERVEDWSQVYGAVASTAADGRAVIVGTGSCAGDRRQEAAVGQALASAAALREQVRADGFATEQMKRTWPRAWREGTPRVVERADRAVKVSGGRVSELGHRDRVRHVLERDGKRLAEDVGRSVGAVEKLVRRASRRDPAPSLPRNPETPPAPAAGAAAAQDRARTPDAPPR